MPVLSIAMIIYSSEALSLFEFIRIFNLFILFCKIVKKSDIDGTFPLTWPCVISCWVCLNGNENMPWHGPREEEKY